MTLSQMFGFLYVFTHLTLQPFSGSLHRRMWQSFGLSVSTASVAGLRLATLTTKTQFNPAGGIFFVFGCGVCGVIFGWTKNEAGGPNPNPKNPARPLQRVRPQMHFALIQVEGM